MKILVVSGFLGAGKTTFIENLIKKENRDIVVLENEYGEVGIDGDLLKKEDINIWEMTEGCICCSMESNFANSVLTISNTVSPEFLIVEPTGVGYLSSVMNNIKKVEYDRINILEPITIVDATSVDRYLEEFRDIFIDQIENSRRIVISKVSAVDKEKIIEIKSLIHNINEKAQIFSEEYEIYDDIWWESILDQMWNGSNLQIKEDKNSLGIENIGFTGLEFDDLNKFQEYMSAVMRGRFGNVVRAKGFLPINGVWAKIDIVDKTYTLVESEVMSESKLILIGKNLKKEELKILFGNKNKK
ncbi:CobW family GTP-binding protein [Peptostreptococcus faecalis]|uniref:GTP-binding protein n=1 Tax=Peptostreptococcus faecalis TaxID=2045015 RepID=UPI000C7A259C|nr:GTP-binding protein [Peptostreptococcus faecalis]